jgi:hypothetical protein
LHLPGQTETTGDANQIVQSVADLLARIRYQTTQLFEAANLSGFVYTQLTDVEQERNGLMTYDRQPKADAKRLAAIFTGKERTPHPASLHDWPMLGSIPAGSGLSSAVASPENRAAMAKLLAQEFLPNEAPLRPKEGDSVTVGDTSLTWRRVRTNGDDPLDFPKVFGGENTNAVAYAVVFIDRPKDASNVTLFLSSDDRSGCPTEFPERRGRTARPDLAYRAVHLPTHIVPSSHQFGGGGLRGKPVALAGHPRQNLVGAGRTTQ